MAAAIVSSVDPTAAHRLANHGRGGANTEFTEDALAIIAHCLRGQPKLLRDLGARHPLGDKREHRALARSKSAEMAARSRQTNHGGVDCALTRSDGANGGYNLGRAATFELKAENSSLQAARERLRIIVHSQHQHPRRRRRQRRQNVVPRTIWQRKIEQQHIGRGARDGREGAAAISRLGHHGDARRVVKQAAQALTHDGVILHEHNSRDAWLHLNLPGARHAHAHPCAAAGRCVDGQLTAQKERAFVHPGHAAAAL